MIPVSLTKIKTKDGIILDGIAVLPRRPSDTALIWIHGLGSSFARGQTLIKELSGQCSRADIAYFKFNTRGHDVVNRNAIKGDGLYGAGFEKFEECIADIRAMIAYARHLGYRKIILAGHSTGANKSLYYLSKYLSKTKDRSVKGLMLLGPVSDIAAGRTKFGAAGLARGVALAQKLSRKNPAALMPLSYGISSTARFLSMFRAGTDEDTFPYLTPHADWKALRSIRVPLAVIIGERDEYLDPVRSKTPKASVAAPSARRTSNGVNRPAQKLIDIFRANATGTKSPALHLFWTRHRSYDTLSGKGAGFSGVIIKATDHGFKKKEKELADAIIRWIKRGVV